MDAFWSLLDSGVYAESVVVNPVWNDYLKTNFEPSDLISEGWSEKNEHEVGSKFLFGHISGATLNLSAKKRKLVNNENFHNLLCNVAFEP